MYAIIDKRTPIEVKKNIEKYTNDILEFSSNEITYNSISGHPDIFIFKDANKLIIAPNSPKKLINFLDKKDVNYSFGIKPVGENLDNSVLYNCISTKTHFFCKRNMPDESIQKWCATKQLINLPQPYVRCSMFVLDNKIVTSDMGIVKVLDKNNLDYFYFEPSKIKIKDHRNGFIGGTVGITNNKVFFLGNILKHTHGQELYKLITSLNKEVICLGNDYLYDGGGLFFIS